MPDLRMIMIGYGGHMSWVSSDSLDFKYSVPSTDLMSDHPSQCLIQKMWPPYGKCISTTVAQAGCPHPPLKSMPSSSGRPGRFAGLPVRSLHGLHSSVSMPVSCVRHGVPEAGDNICLICSFPAEVLRKGEEIPSRVCDITR